MRKHRPSSWPAVLAVVLNFLVHALATPVFVPQFLSGGTGRNIRHLPCVSRRTGETGTCMFAFTCAKANGTHLGTCIDRFYFGSCCKLDHLEPEVAAPQDNAIDVDSTPKQPFRTTSDSNDIPGNVDKSRPTSPIVKLTTKSAVRTTTTTTIKPPKIVTKRPSVVPETTTESIRLSTFQTVSNAHEQRPTTQPSISSTTKRKQQQQTTSRPRPTYSNSATSPAVTLSSYSSSQTFKPTTIAYGQYLTSKKPVAAATDSAATTATTRKPVHHSSTFTTGSSSLRPSFGTTIHHHRNATSPIIIKTPSSPASKPFASTVAATVRTPTVTRFPPRNVTTTSFVTDNVDIVTTTIKDVEETLKPVTTRKPTTTKKPYRTTTKKPSPTKPRPSSTLVTKKPTAGTSSASTSGGVSLKTTTPASSSTTKIGSTTSSSTTTKKTSTSWPTKRPLSTAGSKRPAGTTTTTSIKVTTKKPASSTATTTGSKKNATSSAKPTSTTTQTKLTSSTTTTTTTSRKPSPSTTIKSTTLRTTTSPLATAAVTEKQTAATLAASTTKFTTRPTTLVTKLTTSAAATAAAAAASSTTASQKNVTSAFVATTTVSNEIDTEFDDASQGPTLTSGIVTWSSFSDDAESTTKPAEYPSTIPDTTTEQDWNPITTPDGWIFIASATSEKPGVETEEEVKLTTTTPIVQAKPATESTTSTKRTTTPAPSSSSSYSPSSPSATPAPTTTTTASSNVLWPSSTQSSTYMDVLSTLATVTVAPDFSNSPFASLNMSNFKEVCGRRLFPESRIVGGDPSNFGRWPWQISLRQWRTSTYLHKCGAALLNENWAITAAHCVQNVLPSDLLLRIGEHDLGHEEEPYGFQERRIQIVASHPNFDPRTFEYDLALMRFYEPVLPFQPNILPICVPDDDEDYVGQQAFVTGWGRLYEDGPLPSVLQEVAVPVINNSVCEGMYRNAGYIEHIPNIFICAGWRKGGFDSCEGDSGGPLVIQRKRDKRWVLAGVISWGIGCAEPNQPGVYTRISEFREWINQILQF